MIDNKNSYFPREIAEICQAYEELKSQIHNLSLPGADMETVKKLKEAFNRYNRAVPLNVQKELACLVFQM